MQNKSNYTLDIIVAGTFYKTKIIKEILESGITGDVKLVAEPTNKFDPNAIQVVLNEQVIGYIPKDYAEDLNLCLDEIDNVQLIEIKQDGKSYTVYISIIFTI